MAERDRRNQKICSAFFQEDDFEEELEYLCEAEWELLCMIQWDTANVEREHPGDERELWRCIKGYKQRAFMKIEKRQKFWDIRKLVERQLDEEEALASGNVAVNGGKSYQEEVRAETA